MITKETLRPKLNTPISVRLDSTEGRAVKSPKDGRTDFFFDVNGGTARLVLAPEARTLLLRTQAQAGDTVEIVKYADDRWHAQVLSDAAEPEPRQIRRLAPAPVPNGSNGHAKPAEVHPIEDISRRAIDLAIRVIKYAGEECQKHGLPCDTSFEDVRSLAIHYLISREKNGGRA